MAEKQLCWELNKYKNTETTITKQELPMKTELKPEYKMNILKIILSLSIVIIETILLVSQP